MAEGLRPKTNNDKFEDVLARINEAHQKLQEDLLWIQYLIQTNIQCNWISTMEAKFESNMSLQANHTTNFPTPQEVRHSIPYGSFKLDVPCFSKSDPLGWIFKINQFFNIVKN